MKKITTLVLICFVNLSFSQEENLKRFNSGNYDTSISYAQAFVAYKIGSMHIEKAHQNPKFILETGLVKLTKCFYGQEKKMENNIIIAIHGSKKDFSTSIAIELNKNLIYCVGYYAYQDKKGTITPKSESTIIVMKDGEGFDIDYDISERIRMKDGTNKYLEVIILKTENKILVRNKYKVIGLYFKAEDCLCEIPYYTFY